MTRFADMKDTNPEKCAEIFRLGQELVLLASNGQLRKLQMKISTIEKSDILSFFTINMFKSSLINGHLMVANFMIDEGYPLSSTMLPPVLHECIPEVEDFHCETICDFLVKRGFDVNFQEHNEWMTPLHIAIKHQLPSGVKKLIDLGADVNAIARNDIMPLNMAQSAEISESKDLIVKLLIEKGARSCWRRHISAKVKFAGEETNVTTPSTEPVTLKSFSGGGSTQNVHQPVFKSFTGGIFDMNPVVSTSGTN